MPYRTGLLREAPSHAGGFNPRYSLRFVLETGGYNRRSLYEEDN